MSPKNQIIIISLIAGLIAFILAVSAVNPQFKGIKENSQNLLAAKKEQILFQKRDENFDQIKEIYQEIKPDLEKIERTFVDPEAPIGLIEFWEKTARVSGISIDVSSSSLKKRKDGDDNFLGFQMALIGSFSDFMKFLQKIENSSYLVEIENLTLARLSEGELKSEKYQGFSDGDIRAVLITRVLTK